MKHVPKNGKAHGIDIVLGFFLLWLSSLLFRLHIPFASVILTSITLSLGKLFLNRYKQEVIPG